MNFTWNNYFEFAKFLAGDTSITPHPDAKTRSAVSRAYFAAYCYSRNYACKFLEFKPIDDVDDHKELRKCLAKNKLRRVADNLIRLRRLRNDCDYNDSVPDLSGVVVKSLERAGKVFKELT